MTALPQPANVSQNVPINSAAYFRVSMAAPSEFSLPQRENAPEKQQIQEWRRPLGNLLICRG
jgi:hypothetical protein